MYNIPDSGKKDGKNSRANSASSTKTLSSIGADKEEITPVLTNDQPHLSPEKSNLGMKSREVSSVMQPEKLEQREKSDVKGPKAKKEEHLQVIS